MNINSINPNSLINSSAPQVAGVSSQSPVPPRPSTSQPNVSASSSLHASKQMSINLTDISSLVKILDSGNYPLFETSFNNLSSDLRFHLLLLLASKNLLNKYSDFLQKLLHNDPKLCALQVHQFAADFQADPSFAIFTHLPERNDDFYSHLIQEIIERYRALPRATNKHFAQMFGDFFIKNTPLEGIDALETCNFLIPFLQDFLKHDPACKEKPALETLLASFNELAQWEKEISRLRSINPQDASQKSGLLALGEQMIEHLKNRQELVFPSGWRGNPGHAIICRIAKEPTGDRYSLTFYNTGAGIENHARRVVNYKLKHHPEYTLREIPANTIESPAFVAKILGLRIALPRQSDQKFSAIDLYGFVKNFTGGKVASCRNAPDEEFLSPQHSGTCGWKSIMAFMRSHLTRPQYLRLKFKIRLWGFTSFMSIIMQQQAHPIFNDHGMRWFIGEIYKKFNRNLIKHITLGTLEPSDFHQCMASLQFGKKLIAQPIIHSTEQEKPFLKTPAAMPAADLLTLKPCNQKSSLLLIPLEPRPVIKNRASLKKNPDTLLNALNAYVSHAQELQRQGRQAELSAFLGEVLETLPELNREHPQTGGVWDRIPPASALNCANAIHSLSKCYLSLPIVHESEGIINKTFLFAVLYLLVKSGLKHQLNGTDLFADIMPWHKEIDYYFPDVLEKSKPMISAYLQERADRLCHFFSWYKNNQKFFFFEDKTVFHTGFQVIFSAEAYLDSKVLLLDRYLQATQQPDLIPRGQNRIANIALTYAMKKHLPKEFWFLWEQYIATITDSPIDGETTAKCHPLKQQLSLITFHRQYKTLKEFLKYMGVPETHFNKAPPRSPHPSLEIPDLLSKYEANPQQLLDPTERRHLHDQLFKTISFHGKKITSQLEKELNDPGSEKLVLEMLARILTELLKSAKENQHGDAFLFIFDLENAVSDYIAYLNRRRKKEKISGLKKIVCLSDFESFLSAASNSRQRLEVCSRYLQWMKAQKNTLPDKRWLEIGMQGLFQAAAQKDRDLYLKIYKTLSDSKEDVQKIFHLLSPEEKRILADSLAHSRSFSGIAAEHAPFCFSGTDKEMDRARSPIVEEWPLVHLGNVTLNFFTGEMQQDGKMVVNPALLPIDCNGYKAAKGTLPQSSSDSLLVQGSSFASPQGDLLIELVQPYQAIFKITQERMKQKLGGFGLESMEKHLSCGWYIFIDPAIPQLDPYNFMKWDRNLPNILQRKKFEIWAADSSQDRHMILLDEEAKRVIKISAGDAGSYAEDLTNQRILLSKGEISNHPQWHHFYKQICCIETENQVSDHILIWTGSNGEVEIELPRYGLRFEGKPSPLFAEPKLSCPAHPGFCISPDAPPVNNLTHALVLKNANNDLLLLIPNHYEKAVLKQNKNPFSITVTPLIPYSYEEKVDYFVLKRQHLGRGEIWAGAPAEMAHFVSILIKTKNYELALKHLNYLYQNFPDPMADRVLKQTIVQHSLWPDTHPHYYALLVHILWHLMEREKFLVKEAAKPEYHKSKIEIYAQYAARHSNIDLAFKLTARQEEDMAAKLMSTSEHGFVHCALVHNLPIPEHVKYKDPSMQVPVTYPLNPLPRIQPLSFKTLLDEYRPNQPLNEIYITFLYELLSAYLKQNPEGMRKAVMDSYYYCKENNEYQCEHFRTLCTIREDLIANKAACSKNDHLKNNMLESAKQMILQIEPEEKTALAIKQYVLMYCQCNADPIYSTAQPTDFTARGKVENTDPNTNEPKQKRSKHTPETDHSYRPSPLSYRADPEKVQALLTERSEECVPQADAHCTDKPHIAQGKPSCLETAPLSGFLKKYFDLKPSKQTLPEAFGRTLENLKPEMLSHMLLEHLKNDLAHVENPPVYARKREMPLAELAEELVKFQQVLQAGKNAGLKRLSSLSWPSTISKESCKRFLVKKIKESAQQEQPITFTTLLHWFLFTDQTDQKAYSVHQTIANAIETELALLLVQKALSLCKEIGLQESDCPTQSEAESAATQKLETELAQVLAVELPHTGDLSLEKLQLFYEYFSQKILRPKQANVLEQTKCQPKIAFQRGCGEGKTKILTVMLALQAIKEGRLAVNIVPKSNLETNHADLKDFFAANTPSRIKKFDFNRHTPIHSPEVVEAYVKDLQEAKNSGDILICEPQSLQSLQLKYFESLLELKKTGKLPHWKYLDGMEELLDIFMHQSTGIMDEVHIVLKVLHCLNYALEDESVMPSYRWEIPALLYKVMLESNADMEKADEFPIGNAALTPWTSEHYHALQKTRLAALLAPHFVPERESAIFCRYLCCSRSALLPSERESLIQWLRSKGDEEQNRLQLLRAQLNVYLPHTLQSRCNVHYGPSDKVEYAIPYAANMQPSERASFENYDALVNFTYQMYFQKGLSEAQVKKLVESWQHNACLERQSSLYDANTGMTPSERKFREKCRAGELALLNLTEEKLLKTIHQALWKDAESIIEYLQGNVFPLVRVQKTKLSSSAQDLAGILLSKAITFSGTLLSIYLTLPYNMSCCFDKGVDGEMLSILSDPANCSLRIQDKIDFKELLSTPRACMVIDPHAYFEGVGNLEAALRLLKHAPEPIDSINYFDPSTNLLTNIGRNGVKRPYDHAKSAIGGEITYCDQEHSTGTDTSQPPFGVGILLVNKGLTLTELFQSAKRLRKLGKGQKVVLAIPLHAAESIRQKMQIKEITPEAVILWTLFNETRQLSNSLNPALHQQVHAVYRRRLMENLLLIRKKPIDYAEGLEERKNLVRDYKPLLVDSTEQNEFLEHASIDEPISPLDALRKKMEEYEKLYGSLLNDDDRFELSMIAKNARHLLHITSEQAAENQLGQTAQKEQQAYKDVQDELELAQSCYSENFWKPQFLFAKKDFVRQFLTNGPDYILQETQSEYIGKGLLFFESCRRIFPDLQMDKKIYATSNFFKKRITGAAMDFSLRPPQAAPEFMKLFIKNIPQVEYFMALADPKHLNERKIVLISRGEANRLREVLITNSLKRNNLAAVQLYSIHGSQWGRSFLPEVEGDPDLPRILAQLKFMNGDAYYSQASRLALKSWLQEGEWEARKRFFLERYSWAAAKKQGSPSLQGTVIQQIFDEIQLNNRCASAI